MVTLEISELMNFSCYLCVVISVLICYIGVSSLTCVASRIVIWGCNMSRAHNASLLRLKPVSLHDKLISMTREKVNKMSIVNFHG